jgi:hypothetical protein
MNPPSYFSTNPNNAPNSPSARPDPSIPTPNNTSPPYPQPASPDYSPAYPPPEYTNVHLSVPSASPREKLPPYGAFPTPSENPDDLHTEAYSKVLAIRFFVFQLCYMMGYGLYTMLFTMPRRPNYDMYYIIPLFYQPLALFYLFRGTITKHFLHLLLYYSGFAILLAFTWRLFLILPLLMNILHVSQERKRHDGLPLITFFTEVPEWKWRLPLFALNWLTLWGSYIAVVVFILF